MVIQRLKNCIVHTPVYLMEYCLHHFILTRIDNVTSTLFAIHPITASMNSIIDMKAMSWTRRLRTALPASYAPFIAASHKVRCILLEKCKTNAYSIRLIVLLSVGSLFLALIESLRSCSRCERWQLTLACLVAYQCWCRQIARFLGSVICLWQPPQVQTSWNQRGGDGELPRKM